MWVAEVNKGRDKLRTRRDVSENSCYFNVSVFVTAAAP